MNLLESLADNLRMGLEEAAQTIVTPKAVQWIEHEFLIPETRNDMKLRGRMILQPYQRDALNEILTLDEHGKYKYSIVVWSDIKKSAKCLHPDTRITMADGTQKFAKDISMGEFIISYNEYGISGQNKVIAVQEQEPEPMYRIKTSRGRELIVTGEHPILINGNKIPPSQMHLFKRSIKKPTWVNAKDIQIGDRVVIALDWMPFGNCDKDEMYLLGAYVGDGGKGIITTADVEMKNAFAERFELTRRGKYGYYIKNSHGWLRKHGILHGSSCIHKNFLNSYTMRVPQAVFSSGWQGVSSFLSGYLDADGSVCNTNRKQPAITWGSVSRDLLEDCQTLLAGLGVNATLFQHNSKLNGEVFIAYTLAAYGREQFNILYEYLSPKIKHKRDKLDAWKKILDQRPEKISDGISIYSSDKVVSIEVTSPERSIAIEVGDPHTHITNGIITHNSVIAAAVNLYRATFTEFGEFYVVANDLKQADSRVAHYIRRAIELNPKMRTKYRLQGYRITAPSGSYLEAIPIDPSGEAGTNADQVTFSEVWGAHETDKEKMWAEMTIPPMKHGHAFRWIESYAGFTEESNLLYSLYELGVKQGEMLWPDRLYNVTDGEPAPLELYVNRSAGMICLWNTKPRCPWQKKEYYTNEEKILPPNQFQRIHRNQWVSSTETFVPMEWYDACYRTAEEFPTIDIGHHPVVIALDAATSNDNFAMLVGCRHPQLPNDVMVLYAKAWKPVHGKIDFHGDENNPGPEYILNKMVQHYNVVQIAYDPYQLYDFAGQQKKKGLTWFRSFNQGTDRLIADSQLRDVIRDRRLWHRGEPDLREQIQNANAKLDEQDSKVRIVKRTDKMKIDLAVALSMCCHELLRLNL